MYFLQALFHFSVIVTLTPSNNGLCTIDPTSALAVSNFKSVLSLYVFKAKRLELKSLERRPYHKTLLLNIAFLSSVGCHNSGFCFCGSHQTIGAKNPLTYQLRFGIRTEFDVGFGWILVISGPTGKNGQELCMAFVALTLEALHPSKLKTGMAKAFN